MQRRKRNQVNATGGLQPLWPHAQAMQQCAICHHRACATYRSPIFKAQTLPETLCGPQLTPALPLEAQR